jgi:two-component system sensor histidine kinase VicK
MGDPKKQPDLSIFQQIAQQTSEVWFVYDLSAQQFAYLGPTFEAIWQRNPKDLLESPASVLETIHEDDQEYIKNNYAHFLERKEKMRLDFRILHPDGNERWIALKTYPVEHEGAVRYVCGFAEDDTPRKENLLYMQTVAGKKNAALHIISHDLRGPLGIVQSLANRIEKKVSPADGPLLQQIRMIQEICQRNVEMIKHLTNQEYLESSQVELDMERLELMGEIRSVLEQYQQAQQHLEKQIELTSNQEHIYAEVDSLKFLSIVNNLLSNALKFTPDKGKIHLHVEEQADAILLTVKDNGVGIPEKYRLVLFDKFTKARRPGLKGEESVGLGMSIVKRLVDLHQGRIWLESQEGKGTTFFIQIPKKSISTATL